VVGDLVASWSVSAVNDLIITVTLVTILIRQKSYAQKRTVALVDKLVAWTIETGMLTSASGIIMLFCFITMRDNFIFVGVFFIEARMFSNSLLASLNSRKRLRAMDAVSLSISVPPLTPVIELPSDDAQPTKSLPCALNLV